MNKKKISKNNKTLKVLLASGVMASPLLMSQKAGAASATTAPKVEVPGPDTVASAKYAVIANFNDDSQVKVNAEGQKYLKQAVSSNGVDKVSYIVNASDSAKGNIKWTITNVGDYAGKSLDLVVTATDWTKTKNVTSGQYFGFSNDSISFNQGGYDNISLNYQYVYSGTTTPAKEVTGGFMTFTDIDSAQGLAFPKTTMDKVGAFYVSKDSWLDATTKSDGSTWFTSPDKLSTQSDPFAMMTMMFNGDSFDVTFTKDHSNYTNLQDGANYKLDYTTSEYGQTYGYINKKPVPTELLVPFKTVSDSDEKDKQSNVLNQLNEDYTYTITHTVPDEYKDFYYKSYEFKDSIEPSISIKDIKVIDRNKKDVTAWFDNKTNGNNLSLVAKADTLTKPEFYNNTYKVVVTSKINNAVDLSKYYKDGSFIIPNTASVIKDGSEKKTNATSTVFKPKVTTIDKSVIDASGKQANETNVKRNTDYKYNVDLQVTDNPLLKSLELSDDLVDELDYVSAKVLDKDGKDITAEGTLTVDETKESVKWAPKDAKKYVGQKLKLEITAKVKKDADLTKYKQTDGSFVLPNTATVTVDGGTPIKSDTVKTIVPAELNLGDVVWNDVNKDGKQDTTEKGIPGAKVEVKDKDGKVVGTATTDKDGKYLVKGLSAGDYTVTFTAPKEYTAVDKAKLTQTVKLTKDNMDADLGLFIPVPPTKTDVDKSVLDETGKESNNAEVKKATDYKYHVNTTITDNKAVKSIEIKDDLEDVLEAKSAKVLDKAGKDITAEGTLTIDKEKEIISWKAKDASKFAGQKLVLEVVAQVKKDADLSKYTDKDGKVTIPNTANVIVDGTTTPSDKVDVTVPKEAPKPKDPSKTEVDKSVLDISGNEVNETAVQKATDYKYHVNTTITDNKAVKSIEIKDDLEDVLEAKSAKVLDKAGKDITAEGTLTIDKEKEIISWKAKEASKFADQKLVLEVVAQVKKDADLSKYTDKDGKVAIPNTANVIVDGTTTPSDKVDVTVPVKDVVTTEEPSTEAPTTETPTTEDQTTETPTTEKHETIVAPPTTEKPSTEKPSKPSNQLVQSLLPHTGSAQDKTLKTIAYGLFATGALYLGYRKNKQQG
ncbi:isopeptide-forming domain-containing fimbrial protein [Macrococcus capreoli]